MTSTADTNTNWRIKKSNIVSNMSIKQYSNNKIRDEKKNVDNHDSNNIINRKPIDQNKRLNKQYSEKKGFDNNAINKKLNIQSSRNVRPVMNTRIRTIKNERSKIISDMSEKNWPSLGPTMKDSSPSNNLWESGNTLQKVQNTDSKKQYETEQKELIDPKEKWIKLN